MASLKEMRNRIGSVKSTQKITKALNMVAAAKLKRAQDQAVRIGLDGQHLVLPGVDLPTAPDGDQAAALL